MGRVYLSLIWNLQVILTVGSNLRDLVSGVNCNPIPGRVLIPRRYCFTNDRHRVSTKVDTAHFKLLHGDKCNYLPYLLSLSSPFTLSQ
jgi:hypothetical protein